MNAVKCTFALATFVATASAFSQELMCSSSDLHCLDRAYVESCGDLRTSSSNCLDWVQRLESRADADHRLILLALAHAYTNIAAIGNVEAPDHYRERAERNYSALVARNPSDTDALMGLSSLSVTRAQHLELLSRIVAIEPHNDFAVEQLARTLSSSGEPHDLIEGAELMERAYELYEGMKKWNTAASVISLYRRAEDGASASAFSERVREDVEVAQRASELLSPAAMNPARVEETLELFCFDAIIRVIGPSACVGGIHAVAASVLADPDAGGASVLADITADTISAALWFDQSIPPNARESFTSILSALRESKLVNALIHVAYARVVSDPSDRLAAMRDAARLAPEDGEIAFGLALAYFDLQQWGGAVEEFSRARELLPESRQTHIDRLLSEAQVAQSLESRQ